MWAHTTPSQLYNITLKDINCAYSMKASQINTAEGSVIGSVTLDNVTIHNTASYAASALPAYLTGEYPEAWAYGLMPAYGLFARNVSGLTVNDNVTFYDDGHSGQTATVFDHVQ